MRTLTFTTLFPNAIQPTHGVFVETRLQRLVRSGKVATRVMAPIPWFPFKAPMFGTYARYAAVPTEETRGGLQVVHPRYVVIPRFGTNLSPRLLFHAARRELTRMIAAGFDFDLIDAHYFYPDGVAAVWLGRHFGKPVVVTGRGSDLTFIPRLPTPRRLIGEAAQAADGLITVCAALRDPLVELGVPGERITVLRNGVDLEFFRPLDRDEQRRAWGLSRPTVLSIGNLVELKGHDLVIRAVASMPGVDLVIAGDGPEEGRLRALAAELGVGDRVRFLGRRPQSDLPGLYNAADVMILASSREGWANVLLESMACGTSVVASAVWGTPEVVAAPEAGELVPERTPEAFAAALRRALAQPPDRAATRRYAEGFSWDDTTAGQIRLFEEILQRRSGASGHV
ncbi:MAG: glycosyltransferase family 4 protein [Alphaproteobacteria bacterium]|nr:glycosyltransferase family 4 protein [Alphaproteobacteria bacterium]